MNWYTFELNNKVYEFYQLRRARSEAIKMSKILNVEVMVTVLNLKTFKQTWYTAYPTGEWTIDLKNTSFTK